MLLFDKAAGGHRLGHLEYISSLMVGSTSEIRTGINYSNIRSLVASPRVFFGSADHYLTFVIFISVVRILLGKPTYGIYMAADKKVFANGFVAGIKGKIMNLCASLGIFDAATITPFYWAPVLKNRCSCWVYDLQFCAPNLDAGIVADQRESELLDWAQKQSDLVVLLGNVSYLRGLNHLVEAAKRSPKVQFLVAGRSLHVNKNLDGINLPNLRIELGGLSEFAFGSVIESSDTIWCYFSEEYDQNSGLFCNAIRAKKKVVVRENAFLHWLGTAEVKAVEVPRVSWLPDDAVILEAEENTCDVFLAEAHRKNVDWVQGWVLV